MLWLTIGPQLMRFLPTLGFRWIHPAMLLDNSSKRIRPSLSPSRREPLKLRYLARYLLKRRRTQSAWIHLVRSILKILSEGRWWEAIKIQLMLRQAQLRYLDLELLLETLHRQQLIKLIRVAMTSLIMDFSSKIWLRNWIRRHIRPITTHQVRTSEWVDVAPSRTHTTTIFSKTHLL